MIPFEADSRPHFEAHSRSQFEAASRSKNQKVANITTIDISMTDVLLNAKNDVGNKIIQGIWQKTPEKAQKGVAHIPPILSVYVKKMKKMKTNRSTLRPSFVCFSTSRLKIKNFCTKTGGGALIWGGQQQHPILTYLSYLWNRLYARLGPGYQFGDHCVNIAFPRNPRKVLIHTKLLNYQQKSE